MSAYHRITSTAPSSFGGISVVFALILIAIVFLAVLAIFGEDMSIPFVNGIDNIIEVMGTAP